MTGQSGAGKTTLSDALSIPGAIRLDGDEMRHSVSLGAGFSEEDRYEHNMRIARLARVLANQVPVIVTLIAPTDEIRHDISEICDPIWVYVKRTLPEREGYFYDEPENMFTVDQDKLDVDESIEEIEEHFLDNSKNSVVENTINFDHNWTGLDDNWRTWHSRNTGFGGSDL